MFDNILKYSKYCPYIPCGLSKNIKSYLNKSELEVEKNEIESQL